MILLLLPASALAENSAGTGHVKSFASEQNLSGNYYVSYTEYLNNSSYADGNVNYYSSIPGPIGLYYSNITGKLYAASNISSVYTINPATLSESQKPSISYFPSALTYVQEYSSLFLLPGQNNLTQWNMSSDAVKNVTVGSYPQGMAYDPAISTMFVTVQGPNRLVAVNLSSMNVSYSLPLRFGPFGIVYDSGNGFIYFTYQSAGLISVYNPSDMKFVSNITAGGSPYELSYSRTTGSVFVTDNGLMRVDVINDSTQNLIKKIKVGQDPTGISYDSETGIVAVANTYSSNVTLISSAADRVVQNLQVGLQPYSIASMAGGKIAVGNQRSNSISFLSPAWNNLVVFQEKGLPIGALWSVTANGHTRVSNTGTIGFDLAAGALNASASHEEGYYATLPAHKSISGNTFISVDYHSIIALHNEIYLLSISAAVIAAVIGGWLYYKQRVRKHP